MIDLSLVETDKPKQLSMNSVLTLFESDSWKRFLKNRQELMQLFCDVRFIEKKMPEEINNLYKIFYQPVSATICNQFMAGFKCKLIIQFFTAHVLADVEVQSTA